MDPGFAKSSSASRANIKWVGGEMEGYLASSSNWEEVTGEGDYQRGDVMISTLPHVWIYLGNGLVAEGAADSGTDENGKKVNRSGAIIKASPESGGYPFNDSYRVFRIKE